VTPSVTYIILSSVMRLCRISRDAPCQDLRLLPEGMQASGARLGGKGCRG
jgi:hypothetical protein